MSQSLRSGKQGGGELSRPRGRGAGNVPTGARPFPPYLVVELHRHGHAVGVRLKVRFVPLDLPLVRGHGLDDVPVDPHATLLASAPVRAGPGRVGGAVVLRIEGNLPTGFLGDAGTHVDARHG